MQTPFVFLLGMNLKDQIGIDLLNFICSGILCLGVSEVREQRYISDLSYPIGKSRILPLRINT